MTARRGGVGYVTRSCIGLIILLSFSVSSAEVEITSPGQDGFILPSAEVRGRVKPQAAPVVVYVRKWTPVKPMNPHPEVWEPCACDTLRDGDGSWRAPCRFRDPRDEVKQYAIVAISPRSGSGYACMPGVSVPASHPFDIAAETSSVVFVSVIDSLGWWCQFLGLLVALLVAALTTVLIPRDLWAALVAILREMLARRQGEQHG